MSKPNLTRAQNRSSKVLATVRIEAPKPRSPLAVAARARGSRPFRNRRRERALKGWND